MVKLCLVVFCGLPASGKSTLVQNLRKHVCGLFNMLVIHYDQILPPDTEKALIDSRQEGSSQWKDYRRDIVKCVHGLIERIIHTGLTELFNNVHDAPADVDTELWSIFLQSVKVSTVLSPDPGWPVCLLIDDNMYYSSMRWGYYQLARKYTLSYCQVYVKVAMETSLHRNSIREVKVRDDTIVSMATRFEIPDPAVNTWEVNSVTVESGQDRNSEVIVQLIHQSLEEPVQPIQEVDEEESNQSRVICSKNFLHQADQILRRLVTQEMQCVKEKSMSKQEVRKHAESVQSSRRQVLDNLKAEEVCIPEHLIAMATDSSKNADSEMFTYLKKEFLKALSIT
ncbi:L-seryl-tRNA(Sec) kinase-like [Mya arenaria]|uniref:L-seryl-tRNA(Sec) kinase-like n=1 Tax=Mya arenaria TaxID=6604 RepID=UPI0022DF6DD9|nr:L-seryl-tRNA(Sec) kinase-like [Mya arenaria]XP_052772251.1 L-seryl-tRNA(Sec) kinase-like [Mya arenaria]XP_052772252.1 L-seryl-tRNA(Sec) kinase-like [Mya arenaria]